MLCAESVYRDNVSDVTHSSCKKKADPFVADIQEEDSKEQLWITVKSFIQ